MKSTLLTLSVAVIGLTFSQPAIADSEGHGAAGHHSQSSEAEESLPSAADAWASLQNGYEEAVSISDAGKLDDMHVLTDNMSASVETLRAHEGDNNHVDAALTYVKTAIDYLHIKADGGDAAGTVSALKRLHGVLKLVRSALPEDVRTPNAEHHMQDESDDGHGDEHEGRK